jgi:uncharacterized membrane protein (DUF2068 family)
MAAAEPIARPQRPSIRCRSGGATFSATCSTNTKPRRDDRVCAPDGRGASLEVARRKAPRADCRGAKPARVAAARSRCLSAWTTGSNFGSIANHFACAIELDPPRAFVRHLIARLTALRRHQIEVFGAGALAYGVLELVEGVGLWLRKRWAEWLTVIATSLLVRLELYELVRRATALKAVGLTVNILIVLHLVRHVRKNAHG